MTVVNQDRVLVSPLELQATSKEEVHGRSKTVYSREFLLSCAELDDCRQFVKGFDTSVFGPSKTANNREFLLSCAELDVCRQLPIGFDSSVLLELEDEFKGLLEIWKGSGILFLPNSDNTKCRAQFSGLDSNGSSWESVARSDYLSFRWSRESNSQRNSHSDFRRHDDITPCSVKVSGCKAEDMEKRSQETEKNDYFQLSKSENPYRPPHTYQGSRTKNKRKSHSKETVIEKDSGIQEDTWSEGPIIAEVEQHDIKDATSSAENVSNCPVFKPIQESNVTSDSQIIQFDSKKANTNTVTEVSEEQSRMTSKEDIASPLKFSSDCSSTAIEFWQKALPRHIAEKFEHEKSHESISGMEFNALLNNGSLNSGQKGSFNGITEYEVSELYKFPFILAYDVARSVLHKHNPIRTNHQGITAYAAEVMDSYNMEENECPFDDMWSEIMEILQFEQEMELSSASESNQTADFKVQISFPEEYSLISVDNPASSEHSTFMLVNSSDDVAHYDAKIHLPDEDNLITVEDLIAPLDRLISTDNPTEAEHLKFVHLTSCIGTADYTETHLPDEDDLNATNDLIAPNHLKQPETDDTCMSDSRDEVARPGARVRINPAKGSATQGLEVPPSLNVEACPELHFSQSTQYNLCNSINHETTICYPFNSLEVQTSLRTTFMESVPVHCYPALHWCSSPNMVHQFPRKTASKFSDPYVQYSALQQPSNFLQQYHLPSKDMAYSNSEVEKKLLFPPRLQQTAYPDLAIENSGETFDAHFSTRLLSYMV